MYLLIFELSQLWYLKIAAHYNIKASVGPAAKS